MPAFADVLEAFLDHSRCRGLEPATLGTYGYCSQRFLVPKLGNEWVTDLTHQHFEGLYHEMETAPYKLSTIRKCHVTARRALKYAKREGWVTRNVTDDIELPRGQAPTLEIPSAEDVKRFFQVASRQDVLAHDYAFTIAYTGVTPGEACGLRKSDLEGLILKVSRIVDVYQGRVVVKESGSTRRVDVDERTANIILSRDDWVFGGSEPGRRDLLSKRFKRVAARASVPKMTPRSLRDFYAVSLFVSNRIPVHQISNLLGYKSPQAALNRYGRYVPPSDAIAPEIIRYALR